MEDVKAKANEYWEILIAFESTLDWGRITLYFALFWTVYVMVKAIYETYKHATTEFVSEVPEKKDHHRRSHIVGLIGIASVCFMQVVGYVWFDIKNTGLEDDDRTIGVFNILFINLYMLFSINHFKSERKGITEKGSWYEILKF